MAHQWSGDLVTMAWWDDIWLNEGFASWMDSKASDHFNPDWKVWLRAHAETDRAMAQDSRRTTHPIQQVIKDESEADAAFDSITYLKGQAFIRMIENYLGETIFRDGMRRYMAAHAYSNSTTADLWAALEAASGKPVARIAAGFTEQPGIPLVMLKTRCADGETQVTLGQSRFTIHDPGAAKLTWQVPVTLGRPGEAPQSLLLGPKGATATFAGCGKPVKANIGDVGYYRVRYDDDDLKALAAAYSQLTPADRVNLLGDVWAMAEAGLDGPQQFLDLTRKLVGETELAVWTQVLTSLREIDDLERGSPDREAFRAYARGLLAPVLARIRVPLRDPRQADPDLNAGWLPVQGLVWNLPALHSQATRLSLEPVVTDRLELALPEGAQLARMKLLVRRKVLIFPAEAGRPYFLHTGGRSRPAPGQLEALPASSRALKR